MPVRPEDLAATLVERRRARRARLEQQAQEIRDRLPEALARAAKAIPVRAWLIGSLAGGYFGEASDVDIVVEGLPESDLSRISAELAHSLGVEVDVLRLEDLPTDFRERVLREGAPLRVE